MDKWHGFRQLLLWVENLDYGGNIMGNNEKVVNTGGKPISPYRESESLVFVSGQGGLIPNKGIIVGEDLESQTIQTIENINRILGEADLTLADVIKVNIYLN